MSEPVVDLRSDTVTRPTAAMRRAMAEAEVGDDVFGEDPTVNALQDRAAEMLGVEAGLFVASGTMGNQVAIKTHTSPGEEIIVDERAHILLHEVGAPAALSGVLVRTVASERGVIDAGRLAAAIRPATPLFSHTTLVCLENTHQASGGRVWPIDALRAAAKVARDAGSRVHLDGARIFNASVASGVPVSAYAAEVDSISFCFSKGLAAPVGSMLAGPAAFIERARKVRRMYGGAMRQAGVLAAAARVGLETMVDRLADDHVNARRLAEGLADALPGCVDPGAVETNIVYVEIGERDPLAVAAVMGEQGVRILPYAPGVLRAVTHYEVDAAGVDRAVAAFAAAVREPGPAAG